MQKNKTMITFKNLIKGHNSNVQKSVTSEMNQQCLLNLCNREQASSVTALIKHK